MKFFEKDTNQGLSPAAVVVGSDLAAHLPENPKPWYRTTHLLKLNLLLLVPLMSSTTIGYDGSMMNGLQSLPQWKVFFDHPEGALLGLMNAVYPLGKIAGLLIVTHASDRWGRKPPILFGLVCCIAFAIMQGLAQSFPVFVTARALLGAATIFINQPSPILVTEVAYPTHRGKITALYNTFFSVGAILAAWSTFGTFKIGSTWSWRIPCLLQGVLPSLQLIGLYFIPESPRWLISKGRKEEARQILVKYHAAGDSQSSLVNYEMDEIQKVLAAESRDISRSPWITMVTSAANRRRTLIAIISGWFSQWSGVILLTYYLSLVLNTIGITDGETQTLINGILQVFNWITSAFLGALMVDRVGRRPLLLISVVGMLVGFVVWTGLASAYAKSQSPAISRAGLGLIFIIMFFYNIAWAPLFYAYPIEVFPFKLRARGFSLTYFSLCVGLLVGHQVNPIGLKDLAWKYYIVFCLINCLIFALVWFLFPETKGRSLEQIREVFEGPSSEQEEEGGETGREKEGEYATQGREK